MHQSGKYPTLLLCLCAASPHPPPSPKDSPPSPKDMPPSPKDSPPSPRDMPPSPKSSPPSPKESPPAPKESPPSPKESPPSPTGHLPSPPLSHPPSPSPKYVERVIASKNVGLTAASTCIDVPKHHAGLSWSVYCTRLVPWLTSRCSTQICMAHFNGSQFCEVVCVQTQSEARQ